MDSATHHPHAVAQDASPERPFNANNEASSSGGRARFHDRDSSDGSEGGDSDSSVGPVASGGPRGDGAAHTTGANAAAPAQKRARLTHEDEAGDHEGLDGDQAGGGRAARSLLPSPLDLLADIGGGGGGGGGEEAVGRDHQGRIRGFEHIEGAFPTLVYVPVTVTAASQDALAKLLPRLKALLPCSAELHPLLQAPPQPPAAADGAGPSSGAAAAADLERCYHISLSRTVPVRVRQVQSLLTQLQRNMRKMCAFSVGLGGLCSFVNDERTRSFVALDVDAGRSSLLEMIAATDRAFIMHGLPQFHEQPRPHVSFAWALGDLKEKLDTALTQLAAAAAAAAVAGPGGGPLPQISLQVGQVVCRTGKRDNVVWSASGDHQLGPAPAAHPSRR